MGTFGVRELIVAGGTSGVGRQSAEDVVRAGGSAVAIGRNQARADDTQTPGATRHQKRQGTRVCDSACAIAPGA